MRFVKMWTLPAHLTSVTSHLWTTTTYLGDNTGTLGKHFEEHCQGSLALLGIKAMIGTEIYRILHVVSNSHNSWKSDVNENNSDTPEKWNSSNLIMPKEKKTGQSRSWLR